MLGLVLSLVTDVICHLGKKNTSEYQLTAQLLSISEHVLNSVPEVPFGGLKDRQARRHCQGSVSTGAGRLGGPPASLLAVQSQAVH